MDIHPRNDCRISNAFSGGIVYFSYTFVYEHYTEQSLPLAPVAYQVILEPGIIGQFREFEPRRVHIRINSLGLFLVDKLTCGKRESVS